MKEIGDVPVDDSVVYHAGFPNAAEDGVGQPKSLSLDRLVVRHPASTYFWRLQSAVPELGIPAGSVLAVDKVLPVRHGDWVVAVVDEEFRLCKAQHVSGGFRLYTTSGTLLGQSATVLWGVVTYAINPMRGA